MVGLAEGGGGTEHAVIWVEVEVPALSVFHVETNSGGGPSGPRKKPIPPRNPVITSASVASAMKRARRFDACFDI